jgi:hypothetical protein
VRLSEESSHPPCTHHDFIETWRPASHQLGRLLPVSCSVGLADDTAPGAGVGRAPVPNSSASNGRAHGPRQNIVMLSPSGVPPDGQRADEDKVKARMSDMVPPSWRPGRRLHRRRPPRTTSPPSAPRTTSPPSAPQDDAPHRRCPGRRIRSHVMMSRITLTRLPN